MTTKDENWTENYGGSVRLGWTGENVNGIWNRRPCDTIEIEGQRFPYRPCGSYIVNGRVWTMQPDGMSIGWQPSDNPCGLSDGGAKLLADAILDGPFPYEIFADARARNDG